MLRLPKFDDCINMLACRQPRTERKQTQKDALYLTRGWTLDHEGILQQYKMLSETYDEETRNFILQTLYNGYHTLTVLDTGCYDLLIRLPHFWALTGKPFPEISQHWNI